MKIYVSGGVTSKGLVLSGDYLYVRSGGTADSTVMNSGGLLFVSSGAIANANTVNSGGGVYVYSSGTANSTTVNYGGSMVVSSGGTVNSTTVDSGGSLYVCKSARADGVKILRGGYFYLSSDATITNLSLSGYGIHYVYSGGLLSSAAVGSRAFLKVSAGGSASAVTVLSGGRLYTAGGELADTVVSRGGLLLVVGDSETTTLTGGATIAGELRTTDGSTSGFLNGAGHTLKLDLTGRQTGELAFIDNLARLSDFSLSVTVSATQESGLYRLANGASGFTGSITVCGPTDSCVPLAVGGSATLGNQSYLLEVSDSALTLTVTNSGTQAAAPVSEYVPGTWSTDWIQASAYAKAHGLPIFAYYGDPTWCGFCGHMNKQFLESADFLEFARENLVLLYATPVPGKSYAGAPRAYILDADGNSLATRAGFGSGFHDNWMVWTKLQLGKADAGIYALSGSILSSYGTSAAGLAVTNPLSTYIVSATLTDARVGGGNYGYLYVQNGGVARSAAVSSGGFLSVSSGGTASGATVSSGGYVYVYSGGTAIGTIVSSAGYLRVSGGGVASSTTITSGGYVRVSSGGTANDAVITSGGWLYVYDGGTAAGTTVSSAGYLRISSGGIASSTTINSSGYVRVSSGGTANDAVITSGGWLYVYDGGKLTGRLEIASGGIVSGYTGSLVDFDISALSPDAPARIANLALVRGTPDYAITVSASQTNGTYVLAGGAANFNKTVTICSTAGVCDSLTVGKTVKLAGQDFALKLSSGTLSLTVSGTPAPLPAASVVSGDLNGDGRADVIMTITQSGHGAEGATGAWLIRNDQTAAWGDLSQRNPGWEIFGTGITDAGKATNDVYVKSSDNIIGAWVTNDSGHVTGWATVGQFDDATRILGLGDFNGDGQSDLLLRNVNGAVGCYFTSGEKLGWNYFQSLGDEWKLAAVGDFDGDGRDDVVLVHDAGFAGTWLTQADGTVAWADLDTVSDGFAVAGSGDFNGDGVDDVLLKKDTYYGAWLVQNGSVASWMGLGDLGDVTVEQIADFDGDGKDDLRIRTAAGDIGAQLVRAADILEWRYYGSVGSEWSTSLAAI